MAYRDGRGKVTRGCASTPPQPSASGPTANAHHTPQPSAVPTPAMPTPTSAMPSPSAAGH